MKALYFDCFSGISGDMTLGALLDLGLDQEAFLAEMAKVHVDGFEIKIGRVNKNGIDAMDVDVILAEEEHHHHHDHDHDHEHPHTHDHDHDHEHPHTHDHDHDHEHPHTHDHDHDHEHPHTHDHDHDHEHPHTHDHDHAAMHTHAHPHTHDHGHTHSHVHRNLFDVNHVIEESGISDHAKALAKAIFLRVAQAESKVHGKPLEEVHFHEVGALDSIVDIIGTAVLMDMLKVDAIYSSIVNDGHGFVWCQHGYMPIPAPATAEIFAASDVLYRQIDVEKELVTPTGAAIVAELASSFGTMPAMKILKTGYGAGKRDNKIPNVLRVVLGEVVEA